MAVMLVVQFGIAFHARTVLSGAAQDGAAAAARRDGTSAEGIALTEVLIAESASSMLATSSVSGERSADEAIVVVSGEVISLIPFVGAIRVNAIGSAPVETFRPQSG